jgi:hypothetical protein
VVLGVVGIEVVAVVGKRDEVLRAGLDVQVHQRFGFPVLRLPAVLHLHEADLRRMAIGLDVVLVLPVALQAASDVRVVVSWLAVREGVASSARQSRG